MTGAKMMAIAAIEKACCRCAGAERVQHDRLLRRLQPAAEEALHRAEQQQLGKLVQGRRQATRR